MATTQASVCNVALAMIGEQGINGINDANPRANALNAQWESTLREVLAAAPWRFAMKPAELTQGTPPAFGYKFAYQLPADFISLVMVNGVNVYNQVSDLFDTENGKIITDADVAEIQYVFYQTDSSRWDPLFSTAVSRLLASRIASALREDGAVLADSLDTKYYRVDLPRARMKNANAKRKAPYNQAANSAWIRARRYSTRG